MKKLIFFLIKLGIMAFLCILAYIVFKEKTISSPRDYDSIIVLGAQVKQNGELSNQLRLRLEKTLEVFNKNPVSIIATGAKGVDEPFPEGEAMKQWLIQNGVPENMIFAETKALSTSENIRFSKAVLQVYGKSKPIIITSDYHLPRALAIAEDNGLIPQGVPSPTLQEYWLKNHSREVLAWVKYLYKKYASGGQ